ncbi:hypothetical protein P175DRAFT_0365169 [Aspergillus ochraceoroseus IBT 24754]|uniref:Uncharacterized protein n=1 Tax=Aspergillus ochraceoroseus IBT 24754 TaxID=1392256 RepID=A0A2T5LPW5_9EURO|nr:uncharacterized protein P175DRAFT_0365169 [Aspergillus ochraceoroseus IBT 24754]PTU18318.1 hypothetical protein P175DRAFT_0365169 [Aspergillus ochraceoroseus IBT 24754]
MCNRRKSILDALVHRDLLSTRDSISICPGVSGYWGLLGVGTFSLTAFFFFFFFLFGAL